MSILLEGIIVKQLNQQVFVVCVSEVLWWVQKEYKKQLCHGGAHETPSQDTFKRGQEGLCAADLPGVRAQGRTAKAAQLQQDLEDPWNLSQYES